MHFRCQQGSLADLENTHLKNLWSQANKTYFSIKEVIRNKKQWR